MRIKDNRKLRRDAKIKTLTETPYSNKKIEETKPYIFWKLFIKNR